MNKEQLEELEDLSAGFLKTARDFKETGSYIVSNAKTINDETMKAARAVIQSVDGVDEKMERAINNIDFRLKQLELKENPELSAWESFKAQAYTIMTMMLIGATGGAVLFAGLFMLKRI